MTLRDLNPLTLFKPNIHNGWAVLIHQAGCVGIFIWFTIAMWQSNARRAGLAALLLLLIWTLIGFGLASLEAWIWYRQQIRKRQKELQ